MELKKQNNNVIWALVTLVVVIAYGFRIFGNALVGQGVVVVGYMNVFRILHISRYSKLVYINHVPN